jgi:hypothetical protein
MVAEADRAAVMPARLRGTLYDWDVPLHEK